MSMLQNSWGGGIMSTYTNFSTGGGGGGCCPGGGGGGGILSYIEPLRS